MSQRHSIHQTSIAFDFIRLADAEAFESCAAQWVVQHLLPVIETVFDELCSPHQTLVIDTLTLDLGEFSSATFYSRAPEKLKQLLQEQIRNQLRQAMQLEPVPLKSAKNPAVDEPQLATLLSARQQRWNQLWQFLQYRHFALVNACRAVAGGARFSRRAGGVHRTV
ncbi:Uncharacterised protein [Cedecea neteri]|uniref:Uncharacterized protein n=1 Tax=Cedecea neteri TaxID=158822 RepID=A0A2X3IK45_9ENTR|nr:Uncharacterised protein [Cedecea neteri]